MKVVHTLALGAALVLGGTTLAAQEPAQPRAPQAGEARGERAQGPRTHGPRRGARLQAAARGALFRGIELSEAQRAELRAIHERHREEQRARMEALRAERGTEGARPDSAARAAWREAMVATQRERETEIRAVLTPEQQRTFDENRARMTERMAQARERRAERRDAGERPQRPARPPRAGRGPGGGGR
jgi:Spy/CpxP family protein refolding chaperone